MKLGASVTLPPLISVIDDDDGMRDAISALLELHDVDCEGFRSAVEFLTTYQPGRQDCIISDVMMPGIDGIELQKHLKARGATVPIVFVTSSNCERAHARAMSGGAIRVLRKPVTDEDLMSALETALGSGVALPLDTHP